jgi:hypothetical protein
MNIRDTLSFEIEENYICRSVSLQTALWRLNIMFQLWTFVVAAVVVNYVS